ncbi:hypothetical protein GCM10023091_15340 [Ravibacter arvi]|uniref:Late embryogenesis abundant protein n=1 Tax=Ravibacter arvi TaxID=2051041 RepID=A0ABP8LVT9_9BACT
MKKLLNSTLLLALLLVFNQCALNKSVREAKALGDCKFRLSSVDSIFLAGIDLRELKEIRSFKDIDLGRYPALGLGLLKKDIPLNLQLKLEAQNPTSKMAGVEQMEYKVILGKSEIFSGLHNQKIQVSPGTGRTIIPFHLSTNAYDFVMNNQTRDDFVNLLSALTSTKDSKAVKLLIKIKPTLAFGSKQVNYPGYISFEQNVTADMLLNKL